MKHSFWVLLRNLLIACLGTATPRCRVWGGFSIVFVLIGAMACWGEAQERTRGHAAEFVLSDAGVGKEAGRLLTALTDRAVTLDSPILGASLMSMNAAAERKDAKPEGEGEKQETAPAAPSAPPASAPETDATPTPAAQDFGEVDELDLFLFELSEAEQEAPRPNPDAAPVTAPENSLGGGGTSSSPSNTLQTVSPAPAAEADSRVPSTEPASRSPEGKGVSGISLTELADAMPVAVLGRETATAGVMPIEEIPPATHTWNKQSSTGGDLEWHGVTDWGAKPVGFKEGDKVILKGIGGNVYLCGLNETTPELKASALELYDASWTFRSVGTKWEGAADVDALPDVVDPAHILTVTGDLTINVGAGLLLGEQTTINVQGKLITSGNGAPLSLGEGSTLGIGRIGDKTEDTVALSSLTFASGSTLKVAGPGTLSIQSVQLDGNGTLEMDVSEMQSKDTQLKLKFLGESTDFTQSKNHLTIKLKGLTPENLAKLTGQGKVGEYSLQDGSYYLFGEGTNDQGALLDVLNIVTWDKKGDPYSPFYTYFDTYTNLIVVRTKDHDLYWQHVADNHDWRVTDVEGLTGNPKHWKKDTTPGKEKAVSLTDENYFPSGDQSWHGDTYFGELSGTDGSEDYEDKTRDGEHKSYKKDYSFYRVNFEGGAKQPMGELEHIAVSMRGNMTVGAPKEGKYYWFRPRDEKKYKPSENEPNGIGDWESGAVDADGNIHLEKDGHEQHQFQLAIGHNADNFTEDKLILESSVRFSGNVAFHANVMTNLTSLEVGTDPWTRAYSIADSTELMVGDGATFYRALNKSKRDPDTGEVTEYGFDGTLVIWSQNGPAFDDSDAEKKNPRQYNEWVYNRLREGGDIIHLHVEQEVGGRLQIGKDGIDDKTGEDLATHDGTVTLRVEELTGGVNKHSDGDIFGDTLILNDNGRETVAQYDGTIASSLVYSHSENYKTNDGTDDREYRLNNDFRGPRLTVKKGRFEVQYLRPMFNGVYKWLKGKGDPESEEYVYDEKYDTDSRVVVEKDGKLTIEYLTPAVKAYEGDGSAASGAWCDVVVMGEGEEGGQLNFELWKSGSVTSENVPVKSLWTGAGSGVTIGQPNEQGTQTARKLTVKYLGGAGGTIKDAVKGGDKSTLILDYNKPDPAAENYGVYKKEFEGEYADFNHYDGGIEVNLTYTGTAGADDGYTLDGHKLDGFRLNGQFLGDVLTMDSTDATGKLTLSQAVGSLGDEKEDWTVEGDRNDVRPDVTVNQGLLVLEGEGHIGTLKGDASKSGTLRLEKGGSIEKMEKVERAGDTGDFQTGLQLEVADHLTLNTGDFYFGTLSTKEADDVVHLFFELDYTGEGESGELTGTKVHVNHFNGLTHSTLWVEADEDIVNALKGYLDDHPGDRAEWGLFDKEEFRQTEYRGFFLNYDQSTDLGNDRRIFYLSSWGALVMEDLQADVHWLGEGASDESAEDDVWEAESREKDWHLVDWDSDQALRSIETAFRNGDNIFFDTEGVEENGDPHTEVTYSGEVKPYNMTVEDPEARKGDSYYTFQPAGGNSSIVVNGDLEINSKAVFKNGGEGAESNVTVMGKLRGTGATLEVQDGTFTLETELAETGSDRFFGVLSMGVLNGNNAPTVTLRGGGTLYGLEMHGGKLNIGVEGKTDKSLTLRGLGGEGGEIMGGALRLEANGDFGGVVSSSTLTYKGTSFELYGKYNVGGNAGGDLTIESGMLKITGVNQDDGKTLKLNGKNVTVKARGTLVLGGVVQDKEGSEEVDNVEVGGGLTLDGTLAAVSMAGTENNTVTGNVNLTGNGTSLTMGGKGENKIGGDVTLNSGTELSMFGETSRTIGGTLTLYEEAGLIWHKDKLEVGGLAGTGTVDNGGDGGELVVTGGAQGGAGTFNGFFASSTGLTLQGGTLTLTQGQQRGLGAVIVGAEEAAEAAASATATLKFEGAENTAVSLEVKGGASVVLGTADSASKLTLGNLSGSGEITDGGTGGLSSITLNYNEKGAGLFDGGVAVNFEYVGNAAGDPGFTLGGAFTGSNLTVQSGSLTLTTGLGVNGDKKPWTEKVALSTGGALTLKGKENTAGTLDFAGTGGKVVLAAEGATLTLSDLVGGEGNSIEGGEKKEGKSVVLNYEGEKPGEFNGNVGVDFEFGYAGNGENEWDYTLGGNFTGKNLTVDSGKLTVKQKVDTSTELVELTSGSKLRLEQGGVLDKLRGGGGYLVLGGDTRIEHMENTALGQLDVRGVLSLPNPELYALGDVTLTGDTTLDFDFTGQKSGTTVSLGTLTGIKGVGGNEGGYSFTLQFSVEALHVLYDLFVAGEESGTKDPGYQLFVARGADYGTWSETYTDGDNKGYNRYVNFKVLDEKGDDIYGLVQEQNAYVYLDGEGCLHWMWRESKEPDPGTPDPGNPDPGNPEDPNNPAPHAPSRNALVWRAEDNVWQVGPDNEGDDNGDEEEGSSHEDWYRLLDYKGFRGDFETGKDVVFDNYSFDGQHRENWNVRVKGEEDEKGEKKEIVAGRMSVKGGDYVFSPYEDGDSLAVSNLEIWGNAAAEFKVKTDVRKNEQDPESGDLLNHGRMTVKAGMKVDGTLKGAGDITVTEEEASDGGSTLTGSLTVDGETNYTGTLAVDGTDSKVDLHAGGSLSNLVMNGGTLDFGGEGLTVAGLSGDGGEIKGTDLRLTAEGVFGGKVSSETLTYNNSDKTFELYGVYGVKGKLTVEAGTLKLTGAEGEGLVLNGKDMDVESGGHLVLGGKVSSSVKDKVQVEVVNVDGDVTLVDGAALTIYGTDRREITGTLNIRAGADLNWIDRLVVGDLKGDGTLDNGGVLEVNVKKGTDRFDGYFAGLTGLTQKGGALTLTQEQQRGLGAVTVEGNAKLIFEGGENTASSLEMKDGSSVVLGTAGDEKADGRATNLNLGDLSGNGSITDADTDRKGASRSSVSLNYNGKEQGRFDGSVGVDFKYASGNAAGDPGFVLGGEFSGKELTVQSGKLTMESKLNKDAPDKVTLGSAGSILTLKQGGYIKTLDGGNGNLVLGGDPGTSIKTTIESMGSSSLTSLHVQGTLALPDHKNMYTLGEVTLTGETVLDFDFTGREDGTKVRLRGLRGIQGIGDGEHAFTLQFTEDALRALIYHEDLAEGYHLFFEDDGNCEWSSLVGFRILDETGKDIYVGDEYIQDNLYLDSAGILRWRTAGTWPNDPGPGGDPNDPNNPGGDPNDPNNPGGDPNDPNGGNAGDALTWRAEDGVWQDGYDSAKDDLDAMDWFGHGEDLPGNRDKFDNGDNVRFTEYYVNRDFWNVQVEGKIEAGRMSVTGGNYTFRAKADGSLTVEGLDVSAPATAEFYVDTHVQKDKENKGGNLRNDGELTVRGTMKVDGTMTGTGKATVEGEGAELTVTGETDYAGTLTLNGGLLEANGAVKDLHVGEKGGKVNQNGENDGEEHELAAELSSGLRAGELTLSGVFELGGRTTGAVRLNGDTTLTAYHLSVGGVNGDDVDAKLNGTLTVTGKGSYAGHFENLDLTVTGQGDQTFTTAGTPEERRKLRSAVVEGGGRLGLADQTEVERTLTVDGSVESAGYLKAPLLQGASGDAVVKAGTLELTGAAGVGSQYAGQVNATNLLIQHGTHTFGNAAVTALTLKNGSHLHVGSTMELTGSLTLTLSDVYKDSPLMSAVGTQTFKSGDKPVELNLNPVPTLGYGTYYLITEEKGSLANTKEGDDKNLVPGQFTITKDGEAILDAWADSMEKDPDNSHFNYSWQLHVVQESGDHSLVLDLNRKFDPGSLNSDGGDMDLLWMGWGNPEDVWKNDLKQNWHLDPDKEPNGRNLYFAGFDEGSINDYQVKVQGTVTPRSVTAYDGEYTFVAEGPGEGIDLGDKVEEDGEGKWKGEFLVDGGRLHMQMKNKRIPRLDLKSGAFFIEHEAALPGNTEVRFGGGVLGFGEKRTVVRQGEDENAGDGELFKNSEVWTNSGEVAQHLFLEENERLRIQAGKTYAEYMEYAEEHEQNVHSADYVYRSPAGEDKEDLDKDVVIGSGQVTPAGQQNVVPQALAQGVEKTGRFGMRLQWNIGQAAEVTGPVHVKEGRLTLQTYGEGKMTLKGDLTIAKGGTLHLWGGKGQEVVAESNFKSTEPSTPRTEWLGEKFESRVVLGVEGDGTNYRVNGNNSEYDGTIVLRGDSGSDTAVFRDAKAAGHNEGGYPYPVTRLELHGRALTFDPSATQGGAIPEGVDAALWVNVERIEVADGTENLVGGYTQVDEGNPNAKVALSGPLTGTGVLANAYSTGASAFRHTYTGALRGFGGTIVAGLLGTAPEEPEVAAADGADKKSESIWTLNLTDATAEENTYDFKMAGTGEIKLNAEVDITLTGVVGDQTEDKRRHGDTVDLTNIGKKNITLAGASTTTGKLTTNKEGGNFILDGQGAAWAGTVLQGGGSFTLVEGKLSHGAGFEKSVDGSKLTVDAKGTVDVKGMEVERVGMGDITITGRSTVGEGEAQRERYGRLVGVNSDIDTANRRVTLVFDEYNLVNEEAKAMVGFEGEGHSLNVTQSAEGKGLVLDFTTNALVGILREHNKQDGNNVTDLRIAENGKLEIGKEFGKPGDGGHLLRLLTGEEEDEITGRKNNTNGYGGLLYELGFTLNTWKADEGILSLSGTSRDVYLILNDREGGDYGSRPHRLDVGLYEGAVGGVLDGSKSVVVDHDQGFTVCFGKKAGKDGMPDEANGTVRESLTLRNLIGLEGSTLDVKDERKRSEEEKAQEHVTVNLVNETEEPKDDTAYGPDYKPVEDGDHAVSGGAQKDGFNVRGQDTTFEGLIRGEETVDFVKQGAGQLTVGSEETRSGGLDVQGVLKLMEGGVTLQGNAKREGNLVGTLAFAYAEKAESKTGLSLTNGADATVHDIVEEGTGGDITLGKESVLTFDNSGRADGEAGKVLADTHFRAAGEEDAGGFAVTGNGTDLTLNGVSTVEGVDVTVEAKEEEQATMTVQGDAKVETDGTLAVKGGGKVDLQQSAGNKVGSLIGDGTLSGEGGARLTVTGSDSNFTGTLTTSTAEQQRGSAVLGVVSGAVLSLKDVKTDPAGAWNLDIVKGGRMELGKTEAKRDDKMMRFGDIGVQGGGNLTIKDKGKGYIAGDVQVDMSNGEKMEFTVELNGETGRVYLDLTFNEAGGNELNNPDLANAFSKNVEDFVDLGLTGLSAPHFEGVLRRDWDPDSKQKEWDGQWYIGLDKLTQNPYIHPGEPGDHKNVRAGAALTWDAQDPDSMAGKYLSSPQGSMGDLAMAVGAVQNATEQDRLLAALAGSSISTLTAAMLEDVKRQLESLRSRAAMLSCSEPRGNLEKDENKWQSWINGEMGRHDLDHESWGPGYRLVGWGGTVGGAYEMTPRTTLGLAVTAMYNDLTTDGADFAKGDVDIVYLSSFLRTHLGRWTHTVLAAVGAVDISLDRTVSYESMVGNLSYRGSYKTFGSSRGMTCGFVYEAAYNKVLNEARTLVVQPLVNVEYRHAHVNAYTEKGSDAGLYVNEVKTNLFTIGMGSRLSGVISDDAFGHTAVLEGRALVKMDTGHNTGRANVRFIHGNLSREVESAPTGIFGLEIGAGCTVSLGIRGATFFLDSSAEFRDHYTNVNASSGFSITF